MSSRRGVAVSGVGFPGNWDIRGFGGCGISRAKLTQHRIPEEPGSAELDFPGGGIPRDETPGSAEPSPRGAVVRGYGGEGLRGGERIPGMTEGSRVPEHRAVEEPGTGEMCSRGAGTRGYEGDGLRGEEFPG